MSESFADLFEESLNSTPMQPGKIVTGTVVNVGPDVVMVNAGLKSEGAIPVSEFLNESGEVSVSIGDLVDVSLESLEDGFGATQLSRDKAKAAEAWTKLEHAFEAGDTVTGMISGKVKGGFTVDLENIRAFLPGSLVDVRPIRDTSHLEGKDLEFKLIKLDRPRNNIVVSRRAIMEEENSAEREALLETLEEGKVVKGIVKNLTDYGAFVDLGGIDGLLHITDMAWKRVKHPSEVVAIGDEIEVQVLKFDKERERVSLGLKQMGDDPWKDIARRYPNSTRIHGKVTNIADYGCFVEIEDGVEGLVHMSEMDWTNKNVHPSKLVSLGDEVEVMVLDIDAERRRISLGIKQCQANPWEEFAMTHNKGDKVSGGIKSITDFGIFIGLDGGIDGLIHLSDISWEEDNEELIRDFKKGDDVEAVVLAIDPERERISLGIKQLQDDPFSAYLSEHPRGTIVNGKVTAVDARGATIELAEGVEGYVRVADIARERVEDASKVLAIGDDVEAKFTGMSRKDRTLTLSIKAKDDQEESEAVKEYSNVSSGNTTLGDLLKEQMDQKDS
ncbi:SSU ribosomal protein S1p [Methylophaga thiooxydans]|uniref:30S ribosomal protein S1 n=1 Tax=Methylophaga thiooxydans TaxID=392484 RepID=A0A0A0BH01_9GAMM|nr:30S ribosomal protein S1 [Methylophaga thiooxydans]KGM06384.1 SSU ribosomal protein S1p [Methylophaga thiooxydans]|mmetsp:Transcript_3547/g.4479  ORF Transcript_3547/g.4479 Transcript_3547/m.4479 type:complete len:558 (+) Transcript_3547:255-1928(+)|eukprot:CAMPEP_0184470778 /NCGR_PEP_ID=MMETSP0740-20130409/94536_1 /TAXON_ID=385413 /ORGANISM="Thalassiosira miniscula, Strain CCMP1093" /LENGTH=557 /DNA_ID=CAMNT_0026847013 /DNA_START=255 /DNA_END=1928 /DNA_ORIENTATION=+